MTSGSGLRGNLDLQRSIYGEPLGDRIRRLVAAYGVSQARIAAVIGVSPTTLSHVMSGRRVKLANPAVLARLVVLERRCGAGAAERVLRDVGALDQPQAMRAAAVVDETVLAGGLREFVTAAELVAGADAVRAVSPALARLLMRAGS